MTAKDRRPKQSIEKRPMLSFMLLFWQLSHDDAYRVHFRMISPIIFFSNIICQFFHSIGPMSPWSQRSMLALSILLGWWKSARKDLQVTGTAQQVHCYGGCRNATHSMHHGFTHSRCSHESKNAWQDSLAWPPWRNYSKAGLSRSVSHLWMNGAI